MHIPLLHNTGLQGSDSNAHHPVLATVLNQAVTEGSL